MNTHSGVSLYYFPADGKQWATYLASKLDSKDFGIRTELNNIVNIQFQKKSTRVNVVLLTPCCVDLMRWTWVRQFNSSTTIAVLAGITHEDLVTIASRKKATDILEWLTFEVEATDESVRDLLITIISVYEREHETPRPCNLPLAPPTLVEDEYLQPNQVRAPLVTTPVTTTDPNRDSASSDTSAYDYLPKSSRQVNRIHDVLSQPPNRENLIYLILDRQHDHGADTEIVLDTGEIVEMKHLKHKAAYTFSRPEDANIKEFEVMLGGEVIGLGTIPAVAPTSQQQNQSGNTYAHFPGKSTSFDDYTEDVKTQETKPIPPPKPLLPPKAHSLTSPDDTPLPVQMHQQSDVTLHSVTKLLADFMSPKRALRDYLGVETNAQLDEKIAAMLQEKELTADKLQSINTVNEASHWPTLLHFGAEMDLYHFCSALLKSHLDKSTCTVTNAYGLSPLDLAKRTGSKALVQMLETLAEESGCYVKPDSIVRDSGYSGGRGTSSASHGVHSMTSQGIPSPLAEESGCYVKPDSIVRDSGYSGGRGTSSASHGVHSMTSQGIPSPRSEEPPPPEPHSSPNSSNYLPMDNGQIGYLAMDKAILSSDCNPGETDRSQDKPELLPLPTAHGPSPPPPPRSKTPSPQESGLRPRDTGLGTSFEETDEMLDDEEEEDDDDSKAEISHAVRDEGDWSRDAPGMVSVETPFPGMMGIAPIVQEVPAHVIPVQDKLGQHPGSPGLLRQTVSPVLESHSEPEIQMDGRARASSLNDGDSEFTHKEKKRGGIFSGIFGKKANRKGSGKNARSSSEPGIGPKELSVIHQGKTTTPKRYIRKMSEPVTERYSISSSSSSERNSNEIKEQVQKRSLETKEKSVKKVGFFKKTVHKRNSIRLSRVMNEENFSPPVIPRKDDSGGDEIF